MEIISKIKQLASIGFLTVMILQLSGQIVFGQNIDGSFQINSIQPAPDFDAAKFNVQEAIDNKFQMTGTLDGIYLNDGRLVVGDMDFPVVDGFSLSGLKLGDYVGVKLNDSGKIIEMWRLQYRNDYL